MNAVTEINPTSEVQAFVNLRRQIHMMPELGGETPATAALVAEKLASWGYEVHRGIGGHGLVGVLRKWKQPTQHRLACRHGCAPMQEENRFAHASQIAGRMHACGHDGHTAILLAAAWRLADSVDFDGTLNLIFQPDEEGLCGAKR